MKLRLSALTSRIKGMPGLMKLLEGKYEESGNGEFELTGEKLQGTLGFIRQLSSFHPDKEAGFAMSYKLGDLMKHLRGKEDVH